MAAGFDCQRELQKASDSLYSVDTSGAKNVTVTDHEPGSKLRKFVNEFAADGKVVRDDLPIRWHTYPADAIPAVVCTEAQAAALLELVLYETHF